MASIPPAETEPAQREDQLDGMIDRLTGCCAVDPQRADEGLSISRWETLFSLQSDAKEFFSQL